MKTDHGSTTTHPPLATLHLLFDGHAVDAATARHARDCPSCSHQMQALADQRTALGHLLHRDANWVTAAQRQGRAVLADLLAELARACVTRREAAQRSAPRTAPLSELPRPSERITADIRTLVTRLSRLAASTASATASATATATATATAAAPSKRSANWSDLERLLERRENDPALLRHCVDALRSLEGESLRWRGLAESAG